MSLNSYSTPEGGEMGRAQVVQAEACGIAPHTDMNPVLLKPTNDKNSQVVLNGRPVGNMSARDYFGMQNQKEELFKEATEAFHRLESRYSPIVLEGAGSISELNLRDRDITNMRMAEQAGAATFWLRHRPRRRFRVCLRYNRPAETGRKSFDERNHHQ